MYFIKELDREAGGYNLRAKVKNVISQNANEAPLKWEWKSTAN